MSRRFSLLLPLTCALCAALAHGDSPTVIPTDVAKKAAAALEPLLEKAQDNNTDPNQLRLEFLAMQRTYPGTEAARRAAIRVAKLPSPLDQLDPAKIDADDRFDQQPKELVALLKGHTRIVGALAFAPDGVTLASSSLDGSVRLWKLNGTAPKEWATLKASASGVAFSPDGKTLATGRDDTRVQLWDVTGQQPKEAGTLAGHTHRPFQLLYAPNGKLLLSGCFGPVLRLWDLREAVAEAWGVLADDRAANAVSSVAVSSDGKWLAAGSPTNACALRLWDMGGTYLKEVELPKARARLVALAADNKTLAFTGDDAAVQLWDVTQTPPKVGLKLAGHPVKGETATVKALAFAPVGTLLATAGKDRRVIVWQAATGKQVAAWTLPDEMHALAFAADGRHLAAAGTGGSVYVLRCARD